MCRSSQLKIKLTFNTRQGYYTTTYHILLYHDKIVSSSGQGKCIFDTEKSSLIRDFSQSNRRKSSSLTNSGSYWDSSTWTLLEFEPRTQKTTAKLQILRGMPWTHIPCYFFVALELQWSLSLIYYTFIPLNTEFRWWKKKTHFLSNMSFLDQFSASTVVSMEMAKNEIFIYCLFCFWNGNCWLC